MVITKEELQLWMPLFEAFLNGETIQRHNGTLISHEGAISPDPEGWIDYPSDYIDFGASPLNHVQITNPVGYFRIKPKPNPCLKCKHHIKQMLLFGTKKVEWTCAYNICKYDFDNANPSEAEQ